ncbi:hypothetical protein C0989_010230 [Termitomyces sp. Mn162]|nr:hypothetical protein C0989_010230 [Termitomyces sp. Mn162]
MAAPTTSTLFTPDEALDLLFSPNLISFEVKKALHPDVHIRPLASTDYWRGHLRVLSVLTAAPDTGEETWRTHFNFLRNSGRTYYTVVIVDKASDQIVGVGTVFLECKFQRGISCVGHIEDIAVDEKQQGKKLGLRIIQALTYISENSGAYKTILNCSDKNIPFYEKCGYEKKENEMARYTPSTSYDSVILTLLSNPDLHVSIMSEPYDPYVPRNGASPNPAGPSSGNSKTAAIQQQIDDTVGIMRENITKVAERGERLDSLQDKTDNLAVSAQGFRRGANRVRKNMWWKDMKMRIIIGVAIAVIIVIIVVSIVKATGK